MYKRQDLKLVHDNNAKLYSILISCADEDAFRIVNSVIPGNGFEAFRLLKRRYEPKTPGTKRAVLKSIINNPHCKKVSEVESNLMNLEQLVKRYEGISKDNAKLPDDLIVAVLIDLCHKELREHLELSTQDKTSEQVRVEILNYVERKRDMNSNQVKAMEVDTCEQDPPPGI